MAHDKNGAPLKVGDNVNVRCVVSDVHDKASPPGVILQVVEPGNGYGAHIACSAASVVLAEDPKPAA